jgi:Secretion system C-terminal sorting domain
MQKLTLQFVFILSLAVSCSYSKQPKIEKENKSEAYDALQFMGNAAAFPYENVPHNAYGNAWDFYKRNYANTAAKSQTVSWSSLGPLNVGGRTISIAVDPSDTNIIWLGSASGGLWKSTFGGIGLNAWQYVATGFPVAGVASIAIDPLNHNTMYIGTGETYDYGKSLNGLVVRTTRGSHGIGILKSTDGGLTWSYALNWLYQQQRTVWDLMINPQNPNTIYAATTEGVYKSIDAGGNWNLVLNQTMVMDLDMDYSDTTILYAGVGNLSSASKGLYKTNNSGASWSLLAGGLPIAGDGRIAVHVHQANSNIVLAHITNRFATIGVYRSVNKGATWTLLSSNTLIASFQGWYAKCLMTKPNDDTQIYVGGVNLFQSLDNGNTFNQVTSYIPSLINTNPWSDLHGIISNPSDPDKLYLLTDAGLYRSNDFGANWYWCANGYNVSQFYQGSVSYSDSAVMIGGLQDRNSQSYNSANNWTAIGGGDGTFNAIDPTNDFFKYYASQNLNIQTSFAGFIFSGNNAAFIAPFMLAPSNPLTIYAGDQYLNVSNDQGNSWGNSSLVDNGNPILSMDVSQQDEFKIYFATAPSVTAQMHVFYSLDGGTSFTNISAGLPNRYPRDIAVDPINDNTAYIVFSGFGTGHVYKTINNGATWTDISLTLPDVPFHTVLVNPNNANEIFAGCDLGVFTSSDAGLTWQAMNSGLPQSVFIFDLKYSPVNNALLAFTHGNGVYKIPLNTSVGIPNNFVTNQKFNVYPTLVEDRMTITFQAATKSNVSVEIIASDGKQVYQQSLGYTVGANAMSIAVPANLRAGVYFVKLNLNGRSSFNKIIKVKG